MIFNFSKNKELIDFIIKNTINEEITFDNPKIDNQLNKQKLLKLFICEFLDNIKDECRKKLSPSLFTFCFNEFIYKLHHLSLDAFIHENDKIIEKLNSENEVFFEKIKIQFKTNPNMGQNQNILQNFYVYKIVKHMNSNLLCKNIIMFCLKLCNIIFYKNLNPFHTLAVFIFFYYELNSIRNFIETEDKICNKNIKLETKMSVELQQIIDNYNIIYECSKEDIHFKNIHNTICKYYNKKKHNSSNYTINHNYQNYDNNYSRGVCFLKIFISNDLYVIHTINTLTYIIFEIISDIREIKELDNKYKKDYDTIMNLKQNSKIENIQPISYCLDTSSILFTISDLSFKFNKNILFDNTSIHIYGNCWTMFYGNSGCGKTTLCNLLLKQLTYNKQNKKTGTISYLNQHTDYEYESIRKYISYVKPNCDLFDNTITYNMIYGVEKVDKTQTDKYLVKYGLGHILDQLDTNINTLSTGEKQRIKIIRLILQDKPIWILDEITSNIDNEMERIILQDLKRIQQKKHKSVIHITHNSDNKEFADKIIMIKDKKIIPVRKLVEI
jgi:putative ABC transport system ATP-binding protein